MVAGSRQRFGNFGIMGTVGSILGRKPRRAKAVEFDYDMDRRVAAAFEAVRGGYSTDRILWDEKLARRFHLEAKKLGLHAPAAQLNRRLITIRKNPTRFRKHGIELSPFTVLDPQPSVVPQYAHVLEFSLVKLKFRYGASIDDILLDPDLVEEYQRLAREAAPQLTNIELRLGALYVRKTRHLKKDEAKLFEGLDPVRLESELQDLGNLENAQADKAPAGTGLIEVLENDRYLYISRNENLRATIHQLLSGPTLKLMANQFWSPKSSSIRLRIFDGKMFQGTSVARWQLKLIHEKAPVFNWPVSEVA